MSASSQTEYPVLQATDSISVNEQTQYQPQNQPIQPQMSRTVSVIIPLMVGCLHQK